MSPEALERRAPLVAALVVLTVALATMTADLVGVFFDDALYLLLGKAIAEGRGYVYVSLPGSVPAIHYPPVWPMVLAAAWKVTPEFPANIAWFKLLNPAFLACGAAGATIAGRRLLGLPWWAALSAAIVGTASVPVLLLTNPLLSEPLYLALVFPTLLAAERARREPTARHVALAAGAAALLVLERTIGGVIVGASLCWFAWDRRWSAAALYLAIVAVLLAPWQYFVWKHTPGFAPEIAGSYGPYLSWVTEGYREGGWPFLREVVTKNVADAWRVTGAFLTPFILGAPRHAATAAAVLFTVTGLAALTVRDDARVVALSTAAYLGIVMVWPFQVDRFIWAIWPLLLAVAAVGAVTAYRAARGLADRSPRGAMVLARGVAAVALLLVAGHVTYNVRGHLRGWATRASGEMSRRTENVVRFINETPVLTGLRVGVEVAPTVGLYTGVYAIPVEMLVTEDHVRDPTLEESIARMAAVDRRFRPHAYVLMAGSPHLEILLQTPLGEGRRLVEMPTTTPAVRAYAVRETP